MKKVMRSKFKSNTNNVIVNNITFENNIKQMERNVDNQFNDMIQRRNSSTCQ